MGDDVGEINLVDSNDIINEFLDGGVQISDEKVINELKKLSIEYNLSPADLYAQWLSYTTKNPGIETLDSHIVEELQTRIHSSKIKAAQHGALKAKFVPKMKTKFGLDILESYVSPTVKKEPVDDDLSISYTELKTPPVKVKQEPVGDEVIEQVHIRGSPDAQMQKFQPRRIKIERTDDEQELAITPYVEVKAEPDDHLFKREVLCDFGRQIPSKAWISVKKERKLGITPFDPMRHMSTEEKTFDHHARSSLFVMDKIFDDAKTECIRSSVLTGEDAPADFFPVDPGEHRFFGRIRMDITDEFDEKMIFFCDTSRKKESYQLDLTRVKEFSLFPGQMIEVHGEVASKKVMKISELIDAPSYLIKPFPNPPNLNQPLNIVTASGPFHLPNSDDFTPLNNLLDYCINYRPELLILFGPILEMTPAMFDFFSFSLFNDAITMISEKLLDIGTRIIIVSSPKEWHTSPVFPTPPYNGYWDNVEFYPSPSVIDINGLTIGLTSVDITLHLTKNLLESRVTSESGNRIKRILRHILVQNSLYPLYPPADDVTLETPKLEYCRFSSTPHIIILPSMLRNFIHSIDGCIFINPEKVRKSTIGRIQVFPSNPQPAIVAKDEPVRFGSIESSISAQIIKV